MALPFFQESSYNPFTRDSEILESLDSMSVRLMDVKQANDFGHYRLFGLLYYREKLWIQYLSLPLLPISKSVRHVAVPFSIEVHDSVSLVNETLSDFIEKFINGALSARKYIFSCDPQHFVAAEIGDFSYDTAFTLSQNGGENTDYIIFDEKFSTWMTYSPDRPLVIITQRVNSVVATDIGGVSYEFWQRYFSENIDTAAKGCSYGYIEMFNRTYIPRLPGFCEISASDKMISHSS